MPNTAATQGDVGVYCASALRGSVRPAHRDVHRRLGQQPPLHQLHLAAAAASAAADALALRLRHGMASRGALQDLVGHLFVRY